METRTTRAANARLDIDDIVGPDWLSTRAIVDVHGESVAACLPTITLLNRRQRRTRQSQRDELAARRVRV